MSSSLKKGTIGTNYTFEYLIELFQFTHSFAIVYSVELFAVHNCFADFKQ